MNGHANGNGTVKAEKGTTAVKVGLAQMLKGGVIMDVINAEQARVAEEAGAVAVMALERVPADIRKDGGVARMSDPEMIKEICEAVTIPVMAKARIGHFVEAQILESIGVDYIDESEVLTPADEVHHINKHKFKVPFVCGCRDLGEALRRVAEGAAMIRTKGEAGTGNVVEAVRHCRAVQGAIKRIKTMDDDEENERTRKRKRYRDGVFVGSGIFKSGDPTRRAKAIVEATTHYNDPKKLAEVSAFLGEPMVGIDIRETNFKSYAKRSE